MKNAYAGTSMCHGNFTYWARFTNVETGKDVSLSGYISKSGLWEDAKGAGATPTQMKVMKEAIKKAPTKKMYVK